MRIARDRSPRIEPTRRDRSWRTWSRAGAPRSSLLDGFLADRSAEPRSLLIEGAPGIGKTTLFRALLDTARGQGYAVALCQPTQSELDLSYAGLVASAG